MEFGSPRLTFETLDLYGNYPSNFYILRQKLKNNKILRKSIKFAIIWITSCDVVGIL